ncbi:MAG TPA: hypothetical protein VHE78_14885 [Gemmatimonadaceae bacterium]|nr:hypothetical protein [Gemmatimonadaceae bacterium]
MTAKLSRQFYERFGDELTEAKLEQRFAQSEVRLEQRFAEWDAKWERRFAESDVKLERRLAAFESRMVRWMFTFWTTTMLAFAGLLVAVLRPK